MSNIDAYNKNGYKNRNDYLNSIADDYGVAHDILFAIADVLGEDEDFDGLISTCEDMLAGMFI